MPLTDYTAPGLLRCEGISPGATAFSTTKKAKQQLLNHKTRIKKQTIMKAIVEFHKDGSLTLHTSTCFGLLARRAYHFTSVSRCVNYCREQHINAHFRVCPTPLCLTNDNKQNDRL